MGAVCSSEGEVVDKRIEAQLAKSKQEDVNEMKLLLLGAGESGKSTILKQLIHVYGSGYKDPSLRMPYKIIVYTNVINSMKTLVREADRLFAEKRIDKQLEDQSQESKALLSEIKDYTYMDKERAHAIKTLWADPCIQATYEKRNLFQLTDECRWFFKRIDALVAQDYVPSYDDMLRCRARTVGIVETSFRIKQNMFRMLDMGGQRSERKKWVHCFEYVTGVIYVAAINEFDQVLQEDFVTNRLHESLDLFQEICNSRWFKRAAIIVFLNKSDLFKEKIAKTDLKVSFPDYEGGLDYVAATDFLQDEFRNRSESKTLYLHITCATDTSNVTFTFEAVKDVIIKVGLSSIGLAL